MAVLRWSLRTACPTKIEKWSRHGTPSSLRTFVSRVVQVLACNLTPSKHSLRNMIGRTQLRYARSVSFLCLRLFFAQTRTMMSDPTSPRLTQRDAFLHTRSSRAIQPTRPHAKDFVHEATLALIISILSIAFDQERRGSPVLGNVTQALIPPIGKIRLSKSCLLFFLSSTPSIFLRLLSRGCGKTKWRN